MATHAGETGRPSASIIQEAAPLTWVTPLIRPSSTATSGLRYGRAAPSRVPASDHQFTHQEMAPRETRRCAQDFGLASVLLFAQDAVHFGSTCGAQALRRPTTVGQLHFLPVELSLFAALDAVTLVICHDNSSSRCAPGLLRKLAGGSVQGGDAHAGSGRDRLSSGTG